MTWQSAPGWFDFADIYDQAVNEAPRDGARFVELGIFFGRSTLYLAEAIRRSGKDIRFDAVDPHDLFVGRPEELVPHFERAFPREDAQKANELVARYGSVRSAFLALAREGGLENFIRYYGTRAEFVVADIPDASIDFLFIDADHNEDWMRQAIAAWLPKLKPRGVLAGHDYVSKEFPGVRLAVEALLPAARPCGMSFWWRSP